MPCEPRVYDNVSPERWAVLVHKAASHDLVLVGNSGEMMSHGCHMVWSYDGSRIIVQCMGKPFFLGCEQVNKALDEILST